MYAALTISYLRCHRINKILNFAGPHVQEKPALKSVNRRGGGGGTSVLKNYSETNRTARNLVQYDHLPTLLFCILNLHPSNENYERREHQYINFETHHSIILWRNLIKRNFGSNDILSFNDRCTELISFISFKAPCVVQRRPANKVSGMTELSAVKKENVKFRHG